MYLFATLEKWNKKKLKNTKRETGEFEIVISRNKIKREKGKFIWAIVLTELIKGKNNEGTGGDVISNFRIDEHSFPKLYGKCKDNTKFTID